MRSTTRVGFASLLLLTALATVLIVQSIEIEGINTKFSKISMEQTVFAAEQQVWGQAISVQAEPTGSAWAYIVKVRKEDSFFDIKIDIQSGGLIFFKQSDGIVDNIFY